MVGGHACSFFDIEPHYFHNWKVTTLLLNMTIVSFLLIP